MLGEGGGQCIRSERSVGYNYVHVSQEGVMVYVCGGSTKALKNSVHCGSACGFSGQFRIGSVRC